MARWVWSIYKNWLIDINSNWWDYRLNVKRYQRVTYGLKVDEWPLERGMLLATLAN